MGQGYSYLLRTTDLFIGDVTKSERSWRTTRFASLIFGDPKAKPGAFEPFLVRYIRTPEFIIGLATGSIVLLVGSSALHAQGGRLPWFCASPVLLLGWCVIYGVAFIVWLIHSYEDYQHFDHHSKWTFTVSDTLGFSSLVCFCLGYIVLIFLVTR